MQGKVCLVTGATGGIGKETALALANRGATVAIVGRDRTRLEAAAADIQGKTGNAVATFLADLSEQAEVRRLASEFQQQFSRLDVLLNNAGLVVPERRTTSDGLEYTFALNHLGYFLLTNLLLDLVKATPGARVVSVASEAHRMGRMNWDDLGFVHTPYQGMRVYSQSKLANVLFTYELARRLDGSGVSANCLHPGIVASNFGGEYQGLLAWGFKLVRPWMTSSADGAKTSVYLASSPAAAGVTGKYFSKCRPVSSSPRSYSQTDQQRLWEISCRLTGLDR